MTDEERQRTMDFILQQMARFAASIQRSEEEREKRERTDRRRDVSIEQIRRILAGAIWESRRFRRDLDERMAALIDAQITSEEKLSRSSEWQTQMERNFARAEARMTRHEKDAERSSKEIAALLHTTKRNSDAIARLTDVVTDMARRRGDGATQ